MTRLLSTCLSVLAAALLMGALPGTAIAADIPTDRPIALDEAVNIALGGHPRIKGAEQDVEAARQGARIAESAYWPQFSFDVSRNYIFSARQVRFGGTNSLTKAHYIANNFTFNGNWTLFDFGRTYYSVKSLDEVENSLIKTLDSTSQSVAYDVMDAYFALLKAQSLVKVSEETLEAAKSHLKQAQAFYEVGVKPRFDVTQAEVEVNSAAVAIIQANDAVRSARATLNTRLGADPLTPTTVVEQPMVEELKKPMEDYFREAVANRPDIQALEAQVRSSEASVKAVWSGHLPTVSAGAALNWYDEDHTEPQENHNVQLALALPIFEGFRTEARVGQARANALSMKYKLDDTKLSVQSQVSQAYIAVEDARARFSALESSVNKARENLEIAQGRYEAGVGPLIEVTDARVSLTKAQTDLAQAVYDYHSAYTSLLRSVGKGVK
ncbi:MAG: TolC family protein [Nitrospirae bacterium]|nr:TolC family protein [Nitrospirota bacterium]